MTLEEEVDGTRRAMTISCGMIGEVDRFKYLGSFVQRTRTLGWM